MNIVPQPQRVRCRGLCKVNQRRTGSEYQCEEWVVQPATGPALCWTHQRAIANPHRTEPLQLVPEDASP